MLPAQSFLYNLRCVPGPQFFTSDFGLLEQHVDQQGRGLVGIMQAPVCADLSTWADYPFDVLEMDLGGHESIFGGWSPARSCIGVWSPQQRFYYKAEVHNATYDLAFSPLHADVALMREGLRIMQHYHDLFLNFVEVRGQQSLLTAGSRARRRKIELAMGRFVMSEDRFLVVAMRQGHMAITLTELIQAASNQGPIAPLPLLPPGTADAIAMMQQAQQQQKQQLLQQQQQPGGR